MGMQGRQVRTGEPWPLTEVTTCHSTKGDVNSRSLDGTAVNVLQVSRLSLGSSRGLVFPLEEYADVMMNIRCFYDVVKRDISGLGL